jgi:hypothetical protein
VSSQIYLEIGFKPLQIRGNQKMGKLSFKRTRLTGMIMGLGQVQDLLGQVGTVKRVCVQ